MNRRSTGVLIALLLAALGTFIIVRYVGSAEDRALAGQEVVEVLLVSETVPAGAPAESLTTKVELAKIPAKAQAPGSVVELAELEGLVTSVELVPGEQVLASRFVTAEELAEERELEIPDGLVEVTIALSPERAVGGNIKPSDTVAVFSSFEPFDLGSVEPTGVDDITEVLEVLFPTDTDADVSGEDTSPTSARPKTPNTTNIILHKVMVTNVQIERAPTQGPDTELNEVQIAPTGNLLVTLAIDPENAERIVFTAEYGSLWLANETPGTSEEDNQIQTRSIIYEDLDTGVSP